MDKGLIFGLLIISIMGITAIGAYSFLSPSNFYQIYSSYSSQSSWKAEASIVDTICRSIKLAGTDIWLDLGCNQNIITNRGLDLIMRLGLNGTNVTLNQLAIGNLTGTQARADTALSWEYSSCGLSPQKVAIQDRGQGNQSRSAIWTNSCAATLPVNQTGLYNDTASGNLYAENNFTTVNLAQNDQLNITYYTWVTAAT